jgi:sigma-E factor negative regulatory protein RseC
MYETVEVVTKNSKTHIIEVSCPRNVCENCSGDMFCNVKGKTFEAVVPSEFESIKVGDKAQLFLPPKRTISSTFITLMVPLLCFPLFYLVFPFENILLHFLMGVVGIVAGFIGVALYFKKSKLNYIPSVSHIYGENETFFDKEDLDLFNDNTN